MTPDLLCFAKGVNSGAVPMGGVIARDSIYDAFMHGPEHTIELFHGYTYSAHPLACAAGLAALDLYRDETLFDRPRRLEPFFADAAMTLKGLPGRARYSHRRLCGRHRSRAHARRGRASAAMRRWSGPSTTRTS